MKYIFASFLAAVSLSLVACSSLVDPIPPSPSPVMNVQEYYLPLKQIGASFEYCRKFPDRTDTIYMTMRGKDAMGIMSGDQQCYHMDLSNSSQFLNTYFYSMTDTEAYTIGNLSCFASAPQKWLDLKAPLTVGQIWTFENSNGSFYQKNTYTATVTRRDVKMKMPDGRIFDNVAEVTYVSPAADTTVKWFAKGTGLIYSTSKNSNSDFGKEMRLLGQK